MCLCRRIREKYEKELREVEKSEKSTQEKYSSLKVGLKAVVVTILRSLSLGFATILGEGSLTGR